jgi:AcrR family transcriptional regulator
VRYDINERSFMQEQVVDEVQPTRGELTRDSILAAAQDLFLAQGYAATTMRQIARAVGITPAAIYNHFPGKDEIFATLLQRAAPYEPLFALLQELRADTPEAMLRQAIRSVIGFLAGHRDYIRLALIDSQERDGATLITLLPRVLPHAQELHRQLRAVDASQGRLRDIPFLAFVRALVSLMAGYLMTEGVVESTELLHSPDIDWAQALADVFMYGVLKPTESRGD